MDLQSTLDLQHQSGLVSWFIFIVVFILMFYLFRTDRQRSKLLLPPSPFFRLPVLGHFLQLNPDLRVTFRKFRRRYGDVYSFYMGSRQAVVIGGYDTLKEAFKTRSLFIDRPEMFIMDKLTRNTGILNTNGDPWRDHRRFTLSTLRDLGLGRSVLEKRINLEAVQLIDTFRKYNGMPFDPKAEIFTSIANVVCGMVFGNTFQHGDRKLRKLVEMNKENVRLSATVGLAGIFPFLLKIPGDPLNIGAVFQHSEAFFAFARGIIDDHIKDHDDNVIEDYTSAYIQAMRQREGSNDPSHFTLDQLTGVIGDLFLAGSETTTTALQWSLACLISYPETQTRMYDVINEHVGTERLPSLEDKSLLSYVEAFYMEVLRFCNLTITTSLMYTASSDVDLNGYIIPRGSLILPDLDSVLSDEHIWGDPHNFRPERFLDEYGAITKPEEYIVFFIGKRNCIGEALVRMELFLFLSVLIQNYYIESPPGEEISIQKVDGVFGIVHAPKPFRIVARPRHLV